MKTKTIKAVLRKKFDAWLASIEDPAVRDLVKDRTLITGGCIASLLLKEKPKDFDCYFTDKQTVLAVARYYLARFEPKLKAGIRCKMWVEDSDGDPGRGIDPRVRIVIKSSGIASEAGTEKPYEYFEGRPPQDAGDYVESVIDPDATIIDDPGEIQDAADDIGETIRAQEEAEAATATKKEKAEKKPFRPIFMSSNAITLSDGIQIVLRFYGTPEQIHDNFDFVHCTNYWMAQSGELTLRSEALETLLTKELRYTGSRYPICSLFRIRKFIGRGWTINAGQILKAALQISKLDLTDIRVLEDQLIGVDAAYFAQVLETLKAKKSDTIEYAYLIEVIDRMF